MTPAWIGLCVFLGANPLVRPATNVRPLEPVSFRMAGPTTTSRASACVATRDFQICCCGSNVDPQPVAETCERLRRQLRQIWFQADDDCTWSPRCQVVVHPTLESYVRQLGPGSEGTSGCSSIELDSGRVVVRRIDLRADAEGWLTESLPHELTHVVLADRFSSRRIPRWADEGLAILAESVEKQQLRERTWLAESRAGMQFNARDLFAVDAPPPSNRHNAFYGQSASLVRFLIEQGTPGRFMGFVEATQQHGSVKALQETYGFDSVEHLQQLWASRRPVPNGSILLADRKPTVEKSEAVSTD